MELTRRDFARLTAAAAATAALPSVLQASALQAPPATSGNAIAALTLTELSTRIQKREITSVEATQACLDRIAIYNPKLDAFITVMAEPALAQARQMDAELQAGKSRGPLHGIPIGVKDNIDTAGTRTTGGSALFEDNIPAEDAPVITRLKNSGAVMVGKTNMMEFAGISPQSFWGYARNPWNLARETGGSSTGSGAAVATDLCFGALGTDTGGSVRNPASYCGVVGLKVTNGRVSIRGIMPLTVTLDTCGPLAKRVEDAAMLLNSMAGYDRLDITSVDRPVEDYAEAMKQPVNKLRIGLPQGHYDNIAPDSRAAFDEALKILAGLTVGPAREFALPSFGNAMMVGPYGESYAYHETYFLTQPNKYQMMSRKTLKANADNLAAPYIRAIWDLKLARRTIDDSFTDVDIIVMPTMHSNPSVLKNPTLEDFEAPPPAPRPFADNMLFNVLGLPAITVPCGFSREGLPIGLEIAGPHFSESRILALAAAYQNATKWHLKRPPITPDTLKPEVL